MCNACGNVCCGSDEFGGCGCDGCDEPDCWSPDDEDTDYGMDFGRPRCCSTPARRFVCEAVVSSGNALRRA